MNKMQKEFLKKWLFWLGLAAWGFAALLSAALGEPWHWFAIGSMSILTISIVIAIIYIPIATVIWYWRLMGVCETDREEELLYDWWFWIRRSESWKNYIAQTITEDYANEALKSQANNLLERLSAVKKPKWL